MSLFFRCRICGGRHFGTCPLIAFLNTYADAVAKIIKAKPNG